MVNLSFKSGVNWVVNLICCFLIVHLLVACGGSSTDESPDDLPDTTAPIIQLNGDSVITLNLGDPYEELGASASDDRDGEVSVEISGSVDTNTLGTYTIIYSAVDSSNNSSQVNRIVHVVSPTGDNNVFELADTQWRSNCFFVEEGHPEADEDSYQRAEQRFNQALSRMDVDVFIYESSNNTCSGQESYHLFATYDIAFGEQITSDNGLDVYEFDALLVSESVENTWPSVVLDIIYRDGNTLYFGQESDDDSRPTALDFDHYSTLVE